MITFDIIQYLDYIDDSTTFNTINLDVQDSEKAHGYEDKS